MIRFVNSRGGWGRHATNVWKMRLQLKNYSLHLELVDSMRTLFLDKLAM